MFLLREFGWLTALGNVLVPRWCNAVLSFQQNWRSTWGHSCCVRNRNSVPLSYLLSTRRRWEGGTLESERGFVFVLWTSSCPQFSFLARFAEIYVYFSSVADNQALRKEIRTLGKNDVALQSFRNQSHFSHPVSPICHWKCQARRITLPVTNFKFHHIAKFYEIHGRLAILLCMLRKASTNLPTTMPPIFQAHLAYRSVDHI